MIPKPAPQDFICPVTKENISKGDPSFQESTTGAYYSVDGFFYFNGKSYTDFERACVEVNVVLETFSLNYPELLKFDRGCSLLSEPVLHYNELKNLIKKKHVPISKQLFSEYRQGMDSNYFYFENISRYSNSKKENNPHSFMVHFVRFEKSYCGEFYIVTLNSGKFKDQLIEFYNCNRYRNLKVLRQNVKHFSYASYISSSKEKWIGDELLSAHEDELRKLVKNIPCSESREKFFKYVKDNKCISQLAKNYYKKKRKNYKEQLKAAKIKSGNQSFLSKLIGF